MRFAHTRVRAKFLHHVAENRIEDELVSLSMVLNRFLEAHQLRSQVATEAQGLPSTHTMAVQPSISVWKTSMSGNHSESKRGDEGKFAYT